MKKELQSLLSEHLGELLHRYESEFDWVEKIKLEKNANAVRVLLDIPEGNEIQGRLFSRIKPTPF